MPQVSQLFAWWIIINLTLAMAYDVWAIMSGSDTPTISRMLYEMGSKQPFLYLWLGITIGHILMPLVVPNGK